MRKFERLFPGDLVMKIPGPTCPGVFEGQCVPDGACGEVLVGEDHLTYMDDLQVQYLGYGCYVKFKFYPDYDGRGWFVNRPKLLKISPDGDVLHTDEEKQKLLEIAKAIAEEPTEV
jgi:hypothetical protein